MNKKLMAVAVAGALAAPAVAFAQGSTVQIYGTLKAEYGFVKMPKVTTGNSYNNWDGLNSGSSNIGFKGEEKLGGGMSALFQCESDMRFLGGGAARSGTLCDRNSALGLKGSFGSVFVGNWDSPDKLAVGKTRISEDTGWFGVTHMMFGESNRTPNSINYHSPNFNGFSVALQTTSSNGASNTQNPPSGVNNTLAPGNALMPMKGRSNSFNAIYEKGPLVAAIGYTKQDDNAAGQSRALLTRNIGFDTTLSAANRLSANNAITNTMTGAEDENLSLGVAYTFGPAKVGLTYTRLEMSNTATVVANTINAKRNAWNLAGTYKVAGPHSLWAGFTKADDLKGTAGGVAIPGGTGGKEYQFGYINDLSKRTSAAIGYARVKNDRNSDFYNVGGTAASVGDNTDGSKSSVVAVYMFHKF